jgi:lipopolysaccharide export system permease protein
MSVLSRYVFREILSHLAGVLAVIVGIFLVRRFALLLADAAEGALPIGIIVHLLALRTVMALPSLLPVILYLAVLLALGRLYQDQEMTALAGCGVPAARIRRAVMAFALITAVLIGILSSSVRPWANARFRAVKHAAMNESELAQVRPGRFYLLDEEDQQTIFADGRTAEEPGHLEGVFVHTRRKGRLSVFTAQVALEQRDEASGYRFLRLFDGQRYDIDMKDDDRQITTYHEFSIRAPLPGDLTDSSDGGTRSLFHLAASSAPEDQAELQWRLSMPVSALLLALMALPLSHTSPRQGKYAKLFVAILLYTAYRGLLGVAETWIADGMLPVIPGLWGVHALAAGIVLLLHVTEPERAWRPFTRAGQRSAAPAAARES